MDQEKVNKTQLPNDPKRKVVREWRWWKSDPWKLVKLEQAFSVGCTDKEACGFAGISETQLYYYERQHPEFASRKAYLKDKVILKAKETVAKRVTESYQNAMDYLKRRKRDEFGDNIDLTSEGKKIATSNEIILVNFGEQKENAESQ